MTSPDLIPCKVVTDITVGKIYTVDFTGYISPIPKSNTTDAFRKKYLNWNELNGKRVLVLQIAKHLIKFSVLPINDPKQNKTGPTGEWCLCAPNYLYKSQAQNHHANCSCNLWTTGCTCGLFKAEQKQKT